MSDPKFTPGPWTVYEKSKRGTRIFIGELTGCYADVVCSDYEDEESNARLITAAPELYEALQNVYSECCPDVMDITKPTELSLKTWERIRDLLHKICPPGLTEDDGRDWDNEAKQWQDDMRESDAPTPYDP